MKIARVPSTQLVRGQLDLDRAGRDRRGRRAAHVTGRRHRRRRRRRRRLRPCRDGPRPRSPGRPFGPAPPPGTERDARHRRSTASRRPATSSPVFQRALADDPADAGGRTSRAPRWTSTATTSTSGGARTSTRAARPATPTVAAAKREIDALNAHPSRARRGDRRRRSPPPSNRIRRRRPPPRARRWSSTAFRSSPSASTSPSAPPAVIATARSRPASPCSGDSSALLRAGARRSVRRRAHGTPAVRAVPEPQAVRLSRHRRGRAGRDRTACWTDAIEAAHSRYPPRLKP